MLHHPVRFAIVQLVKLFYPRIELQGRERIPIDGPVIFVLNHPNGLLDPLLLMAKLDRPIAFLAKSTFWRNPLGRLCMEAFGALPVFRQQDRATGERGSSAARNEATFARCRAILHNGGALALFPEGTTHSGSELLPLKTGAARIALGAEAESGWQTNLKIVPVGLWYQNKTLFRSATLLVVGEPWTITDMAATHNADPEAAVDAVTDRIREALATVVLQAEHAEVLAGMPLIAAWTSPDGPPATLAERRSRTARLLDAYKRLTIADPPRAAMLAQHARRYARLLRMLGIADPWALELAAPRRTPLLWRALLLLVSLPLALAGFALSYGPYRLAGKITPPLVGRHDTLLGTGKLISGAALILIGWIVWALAIGFLASAWWGVAVFLAAPALAYVALRWGETWRELRDGLSVRWLRRRQRALVHGVVERRQALASEVIAALDEAGGEVRRFKGVKA